MKKSKFKIVDAFYKTHQDLELRNLLEELLFIWRSNLDKNRLKRKYYDGENVLKDLGIAIPPPLQNVETVVGWPKKAVSALASRVIFDGFTASDEEISNVLDEIVETSQLKRKCRQAIESELIIGCDFITLSRGEDDEAPVIIITHSAQHAAAKWDNRLGDISSGVVIMDYLKAQPSEVALYTEDNTYHIELVGDFVEVEEHPHRMGRPLMVALAYNPTEDKPLGQSRITSAVRSITDSAVREALRTEISAEFFTTPQKYLLGGDGTEFDDKPKWEAYIGSIVAFTKTEDGDTPKFGQLSQGTMQPHIDYMRSLGARFSGETNVPISQLGIIHDNPSSAQAIYAASEPLIIEAENLIADNSDSLITLAKLAYCIYKDLEFLQIANELKISAKFRSPVMPSIASQADAMVKIASVVDGFAKTEVFWEMLGFDEDRTSRLQQQLKRQEAMTGALTTLAATIRNNNADI